MFQKHLQKAADSIEKRTLYVVATPIGNLADITLRALAVLQKADIICAEDTRVTAQLLSAYGIQGKLVSVREHNEQQMADKIINHLSDDLTVAQVSDALRALPNLISISTVSCRLNPANGRSCSPNGCRLIFPL